MAVVHVPPKRGGSGGRGGAGAGVGTVRRLAGIAVLVVAAAAAGFIWWGRLAPDRNGDVVAYVQQFVDGGGGTGADPVEADARHRVRQVATNAGADVNIRVRKGDVPGGDGQASHAATVSNDVGDEIVLRIVCDGPNRCRVIAVEGHVQADPNADIKKREPASAVQPPGIRIR